MTNDKAVSAAGAKSYSAVNGGTSATIGELKIGLPIGQSMAQLLNNQYVSDVVFKVGQAGVLIYAHKNIITLASEVFFAQFSEHWTMKSENDQPVPVSVPDIEPDVFIEVLRSIYCGGAEINADNMLHIYYASQKYMLQQLSTECEEVIRSLTTEVNVLKVFQDNREHKFDEVDKLCLQIICDNPLKLLKQNYFLDLSPEALLMIAAQSTIHCHEDQMHKAIESWKTKNGEIDVVLNIQDMTCRKLHFFGPAQFSENIDTLLRLCVKSKIALYGVGIFVGVDQENPPDGELDIIVCVENEQLASKTVPIHKNFKTHEIMFEKVTIDSKCSIHIKVKKPDTLKELKLLHTNGLQLAGTLGNSQISCQPNRCQSCYNNGYSCNHVVNCVSYLMCKAV